MRQDALKGKMSTEHHLKMNIYLITIEAEYTDSSLDHYLHKGNPVTLCCNARQYRSAEAK